MYLHVLFCNTLFLFSLNTSNEEYVEFYNIICTNVPFRPLFKSGKHVKDIEWQWKLLMDMKVLKNMMTTTTVQEEQNAKNIILKKAVYSEQPFLQSKEMQKKRKKYTHSWKGSENVLQELNFPLDIAIKSSILAEKQGNLIVKIVFFC